MNKQTSIIIGAAAIIVVGLLYWGTRGTTAEPSTTNASQMPITSGENAEPGNAVHGLPVEPAAAVVRKDLAAKLSIDEKSITIMLIEEKTWGNGCLGLGGAEEMCSMALVDGFRVELLAQGKSYFYRTDKTGASFRSEVQ